MACDRQHARSNWHSVNNICSDATSDSDETADELKFVFEFSIELAARIPTIYDRH